MANSAQAVALTVIAAASKLAAPSDWARKRERVRCSQKCRWAQYKSRCRTERSAKSLEGQLLPKSRGKFRRGWKKKRWLLALTANCGIFLVPSIKILRSQFSLRRIPRQ